METLENIEGYDITPEDLIDIPDDRSCFSTRYIKFAPEYSFFPTPCGQSVKIVSMDDLVVAIVNNPEGESTFGRSVEFGDVIQGVRKYLKEYTTQKTKCIFVRDKETEMFDIRQVLNIELHMSDHTSIKERLIPLFETCHVCKKPISTMRMTHMTNGQRIFCAQLIQARQMLGTPV